jgi:phosphatidylcholine synthase
MLPFNWHAAFGIHILTASGAACALLALIAAAERAWPAMFMWLGVALLVDGVDGPLARRFGVGRLLPRWSGETLDLVVDFLTYVFVPAFAIARSGLLPEMLAAQAAIAIVISSALYFADRRMKLDDNYFRGFPALWNAVAFYLILLMPPPWLATAAVAALVVITFVPFPFIHPLRVVQGRSLNIAMLIAWAVLAIVALVRDMAPGVWVTAALCLIAIYMATVGIIRQTFHKLVT